jgi:hypothetical protein
VGKIKAGGSGLGGASMSLDIRSELVTREPVARAAASDAGRLAAREEIIFLRNL